MHNAWALAWVSDFFAGSMALFFASCLLAQDGQWSEGGQNFLFDEGMAKYCCYIEMTKTVNQRQRAKIRQRKPINVY